MVHHGVVPYSPRKDTKDKRSFQYLVIIYDHTNDQMYTHCYSINKTSNQPFIVDFIRRVNIRYDSSIKIIFVVVLDKMHLYTGQKRQKIQ